MIGVVWHYWIGVALVVGAIATIVGIAGMYFRNVEATRYPKGR
ncbi:MAG TPA: hypothetical protein VF743_11460 [Acidimicrobiales bacterium]